MKEYRLKNLPFRKGYFWSYYYNTTSLPLFKITEQLIKYGNLDDHLNLFKIFPYNELKEVYYNEVRLKMSGEVVLRDGITPSKQDLRNVKYMDFLFEALKDVAA